MNLNKCLATGRLLLCCFDPDRMTLKRTAPETRQMLKALQVHRILLADSGTLLVCLIDRNGILNHLREQLTRAFPGAPMRQTQIMHVSVLRLLTAQQLSNEERHRLQAICDEYTIKLKGMQITATELW